ncbi:MAG: NAD(P)-dependent oxidoreductase [bacterium]|nr:NAD(P)-dependent oxidoreductase [bacterium]
MTSHSNLKTIIIDDFHPVLLETLNANNIPFHYLPDISEQEAIKALALYDIAIVRSKVNFTSSVLENLPQLKCIARGGAGMDNIDEQAAKLRNIVLLNAPEGNRNAVAEHTIGLMLSLSNQIVKSNSEVKAMQWHREANRGYEIGSKTIGILGFGNTGQALAKKLKSFGSKLIAFDKFAPSADKDVEAVSLSELQSRSDIISLHLPLTSETKYLVNLDFLDQCKPGFTLINTSRGKVVNQLDVLAALQNGKLKAFAADVLENEKFGTYTQNEIDVFNTLATLSQVVLTPHVAGWTHESYYKIAEVIALKLLEFTTNLKKY